MNRTKKKQSISENQTHLCRGAGLLAAGILCDLDLSLTDDQKVSVLEDMLGLWDVVTERPFSAMLKWITEVCKELTPECAAEFVRVVDLVKLKHEIAEEVQP